MTAKKKILVVGITPPPYGGQALMTERLLNGNYDRLELTHVRMSFSESMASVGRFRIGKVFHMISVIWRSLAKWRSSGVNTLYYMPGGAGYAPIYRDIIILGVLRIFFKKTIFHFRAAGACDLVSGMRPPLRNLARLVYGRPDLAIQLASLNPPDGEYFRAKRTVIIPNGMEDLASARHRVVRSKDGPVRILYVGVLEETKGVMIALQACKILFDRGVRLSFVLVGEFASKSFASEAIKFCQKNLPPESVHFAGVQTGDPKLAYYAQSDIFCFPSFFTAESFGNVLVEAMMFRLPVVATKWRGIPEVVEDGQTGILTEIKSAEETASALQRLIEDPELRSQMGKNGRERFEQRFQISEFLRRMEENLSSI